MTTSRVKVSFSVMQLRLVVGKIIGIAGMSLLGTCVGVASFVGFVPMRAKKMTSLGSSEGAPLPKGLSVPDLVATSASG